MSKKPKAEKEDVEELALKARIARQEACTKEVNEVLERNKCQMIIVVQVGQQVVPLGQVLNVANLPAQVLVASK